MSTRAAYFFKDGGGHHMVYKHCGGYPAGAVEWLNNARALSWAGDRFEADEAAASFVCAAKLAGSLGLEGNKPVLLRYDHFVRGGDVRLMNPSPTSDIFEACIQCSDVAYAYVVTMKRGDWYVEVYSTNFWPKASKENAEFLWKGPLSKMKAWAEKVDA